MADRRPLSIQESTYFVGSNSFRGGPTSLTKSREEMVFVNNDAQDGVAIRFICENPRSHSLEEIGIVDRVVRFSGTPRTGSYRHKKALVLDSQSAQCDGGTN